MCFPSRRTILIRTPSSSWLGELRVLLWVREVGLEFWCTGSSFPCPLSLSASWSVLLFLPLCVSVSSLLRFVLLRGRKSIAIVVPSALCCTLYFARGSPRAGLTAGSGPRRRCARARGSDVLFRALCLLLLDLVCPLFWLICWSFPVPFSS